MGALRDWLLSITAAALAVALAQALTPAGTVKKVGRLVGGLVLLLVVVRPVLQLDMGELAVDVAGYTVPEMTTVAEDVLASHIADSTAAYIEERAAELGCCCTAQVEVETGEDGWPLPVEAELTGTLTEGQRLVLARMLMEELNIQTERQHFKEVER